MASLEFEIPRNMRGSWPSEDHKKMIDDLKIEHQAMMRDPATLEALAQLRKDSSY